MGILTVSGNDGKSVTIGQNAITIDNNSVALQKDTISKSGDRGTLAGYEQQTQLSGTTITVSYDSSDSLFYNASGKTSLTISVSGNNLPGLVNATSIKVLFIYNATSLTSITFNGTNGITTIDFEGEGAPSLDGKNIIRVVFFLHDVTASTSIKQWD